MHIYALPETGHLKDQSTSWIILLKLLQCQKLVNEYAPEIVDLLLQELQPSEICTELGLCTSGKKLLRGEKKKHITVTPLANICACVSLTWMAFHIKTALSPFSTRRLFSRETTFSFVGVAYHISKCDTDKGKSRFARKKSPSGKRT